jgi:transposase InsO family protein
MEEVFDAIDEWHRGNNHMGQERTWTYCRDKYFNITQKLVKHDWETCIVYCKKNPATKPTKGSRKPIKSKTFRERFQFDLIDFCKLRKRDPFGVLMRWILVIKDHATGFIYLCALPRKQANLVACKLEEIFGVIGYPKIMHSDNGKEFRAKIVLELLRNLNPNILSAYGQPRYPQDQGSVESMNKFVKRNIGSVLAECRLLGKNPNWTEVLGSVVAVINSQHGCCKDNVSLFEVVYGQVFDHELSCTKEKASQCWTVPQQLKVTNNPEFEAFM